MLFLKATVHVLPRNYSPGAIQLGRAIFSYSVLQIMSFSFVCRPGVTQPYNQGAANMTGAHPSYPQHYGPPPSMQQVTNQMTRMQMSGPPTPAGPGYGKFHCI